MLVIFMHILSAIAIVNLHLFFLLSLILITLHIVLSMRNDLFKDAKFLREETEKAIIGN
jgi:hypothetical protein